MKRVRSQNLKKRMFVILGKNILGNIAAFFFYALLNRVHLRLQAQSFQWFLSYVSYTISCALHSYLFSNFRTLWSFRESGLVCGQTFL